MLTKMANQTFGITIKYFMNKNIKVALNLSFLIACGILTYFSGKHLYGLDYFGKESILIDAFAFAVFFFSFLTIMKFFLPLILNYWQAQKERMKRISENTEKFNE